MINDQASVQSIWLYPRCLTEAEAKIADKALRDGDEETVIGLGGVKTDMAAAEYESLGVMPGTNFEGWALPLHNPPKGCYFTDPPRSSGGSRIVRWASLDSSKRMP